MTLQFLASSDRYKGVPGVYQISNTVNGKSYIGSTFLLRKRFQIHLQKMRRGNHEVPAIQSDYLQYGESSFTAKVLYCENEDWSYCKDLDAIERKYIATLLPEYNTNIKKVTDIIPGKFGLTKTALIAIDYRDLRQKIAVALKFTEGHVKSMIIENDPRLIDEKVISLIENELGFARNQIIFNA